MRHGAEHPPPLAHLHGETPPIPPSSIEKPPSAELRPGQLDSDSLPDYHVLDDLLDDYVENDRGAAELDEGLREEVITQIDPAALSAAVRELDTDDVVDLVEDMDRVKRTIESHRLRGALLTSISHDLKTPLTRLRGQIELVLTALPELRELPDAAARLTRAARTCEELTRTTEALLALSRNQCSIEETIDLEEVVQRASASLLPAERQRLRTRCEEAALVRGDESLLILAAANLIDNALKYTPGPVVVRVCSGSGSCALFVEDSGSGIAEEDLSRIRQPFVRGQAHAAVARGTGLGLALVDHVATVHKGSLHLKNLQPAGLCAELRLPAWQPRTNPGVERAVR